MNLNNKNYVLASSNENFNKVVMNSNEMEQILKINLFGKAS